ncbi:YraN family protein [Patescibacteria group bacterium]|nr:YraN family protein [Patescibacteria group bacterium]
MAVHNTIGKEGEEIAKKYLESKGYKIIEQNYRTKRAEIDIITKHKNKLVFVEVRTKHHEQFGTPEDTINYQKRKRLQKNAAAYVHRKRYKGPYRIDAVCLVIDKNEGLRRINHYENIVES